MVRYLAYVVLFLSLTAEAQFSYNEDQTIPVGEPAERFGNAWAGGINSGQFSTIDLNGDNMDDLLVFDRMANKVLTFLKVDGSYQYQPQYEDILPSGIERFVLLRDYNCDGKKDLFTGDVLGIKVFTNVSTNGMLSWEQFFFRTTSGAKRPVILTKGFTQSNLQIQPDDLPALIDADGDGDLDIFNMRYPSSLSVEYHKNFSVERYGRCDSLEFERITQTWGNFIECGCGSFAFNGESCPGGGRTKHQGGKTLLALDANGDNTIDLVMGEAECRNLFLLPNTGTLENPVITSRQVFPSEIPVDYSIFPAVYFEDVDTDGARDIISSPNLYGREFRDTDLQSSVWYYKNTGTNLNPAFELVTKSFLQDEMIDVGDNAVPAFYDIDGDADLDMLVSSNITDDNHSEIFYFRNAGTSSNPSFDAPISFGQLTFSLMFNLKIAFHDMNHDGKTDLVFTGSIGTNTRLYYIPNESNNGLSLGDESVEVAFPLTSEENLSFADVNEDGFIDILAGRSNGRVELWQNSGVAGPPVFSLTDENYLLSDGSTLSQSLSVSTGDLDGDGKDDMVYADQSGEIAIISDFRSSENRAAPHEEVIRASNGELTSRNLGGRIWPRVVNLYGTDKAQIAVGTTLGGVKYLTHDNGMPIEGNIQVNVYPNRISRQDDLKIQANNNVRCEIFNSVGQRVGGSTDIAANVIHEVSISHLTGGLYFLKFSAGNQSAIRRLVVF